MLYRHDPPAYEACRTFWADAGYIPFRLINDLAMSVPLEGTFEQAQREVFQAFNGADKAQAAIAKAAEAGDDAARGLLQYAQDTGLATPPYSDISAETFQDLRPRMLADPDSFMADILPGACYPHYVPGRRFGYHAAWVQDTLAQARRRFAAFSDGRGSDTAILVGNGPSLNKIDFNDLKGQDVYLSNYAINNPGLAACARGVAVTNYLVAEQEPYRFQLGKVWKFQPLWLANTLPSTPHSILLNALGGELFFSTDVTQKVAWHSTVTYFWLQILYAAGYRKVVMIGFDHSYTQKAGAKEGDLIAQKEDDANHFDANYFKGKTWQAADSGKMEETYVKSKAVYEADGREIVNATVGGKLEVFRRADLRDELAPPRRFGRLTGAPAPATPQPDAPDTGAADATPIPVETALTDTVFSPETPVTQDAPTAIAEADLAPAPAVLPPAASKNPPGTRVAIVTAFWKGDIEQTDLHWQLINRLGTPGPDHIHLFKHGPADLPPHTFPRCIAADIEGRYPEAQKPHPAGPNLAFVEAVRLLLQTDYTHFFWMEPDCVPTSADWMQPFLDKLAQYPDEPIIGTGGGTVSPGKTHWRHHFAGCSMYSLKALAQVDWDRFLAEDLHVSFDVWLTVQLGYVELGGINDEDQTGTLIYGEHRYDWAALRTPPCLVHGMFEHWRPEKFLSTQSLEERLDWPGFSLYHAIKDKGMIERLYRRLPKSASTIVINFNNGPYLEAAIASALNQDLGGTGIRHEVIVVDDGSTDASREIIAGFGSRIVPVLLDHGVGRANFNHQRGFKAGLARTSGEVIFLLDGDDTFMPEKIARGCAWFDDPRVVLGQHELTLIDADGETTAGQGRFFPERTITPTVYADMGRVNLFQPTSGLCFRRSYLASQLPRLAPDDHPATWLDVRTTRFAPYHGKIFSSRVKLGAWRRHAASDSIRTDNIHTRVRDHDRWFDVMARCEGMAPVPFAWKEVLTLGPENAALAYRAESSGGYERVDIANDTADPAAGERERVLVFIPPLDIVKHAIMIGTPPDAALVAWDEAVLAGLDWLYSGAEGATADAEAGPVTRPLSCHDAQAARQEGGVPVWPEALIVTVESTRTIRY